MEKERESAKQLGDQASGCTSAVNCCVRGGGDGGKRGWLIACYFWDSGRRYRMCCTRRCAWPAAGCAAFLSVVVWPRYCTSFFFLPVESNAAVCSDRGLRYRSPYIYIPPSQSAPAMSCARASAGLGSGTTLLLFVFQLRRECSLNRVKTVGGEKHGKYCQIIAHV